MRVWPWEGCLEYVLFTLCPACMKCTERCVILCFIFVVYIGILWSVEVRLTSRVSIQDASSCGRWRMSSRALQSIVWTKCELCTVVRRKQSVMLSGVTTHNYLVLGRLQNSLALASKRQDWQRFHTWFMWSCRMCCCVIPFQLLTSVPVLWK